MKLFEQIGWAGVAGVTVYVAAALIFFMELLGDVTGIYLHNNSWFTHELTEIFTFIGFLVGAALIWHSHRSVLLRNREIEKLLRAAQGEFSAMITLQFDEWGLSEAERDIAMLTTKGMSVAEIAELRHTTIGTVKSQNSSIYRKAGVNSRTQLISVLIEDLLIHAPPESAAIT